MGFKRAMEQTIKKVGNFLASPNFLKIIIGLFLLQAVWFGVSIKPDIPPDEIYHYQLTSYYAHRPITAGPVISDQQDNFVLGDIERTPSYLYHYLLSFPLKGIQSVFGGMLEQIILLRLINIAFGVLSLLVIYKTFGLLVKSKLAANMGLLLTTTTGAFLWLTPAVNYDNLAILLFLGTVYCGLLCVRQLSLRKILLAAILSIATILTKITFAPVLVVFLLIILFVCLRSIDKKKWLKAIKKELKNDRWALAALTILLLVLMGLFAERIGRNLVEYKTMTPTCSRVHSIKECGQNDLYRRNVLQDEAFQKFKDSGQQLQYSPLSFAGGWLDQMYDGLFFYSTRNNIEASDNVANLAVFFVLIIIMLIILYRQNLPSLSVEQKIVVALVCFYVGILYVFNLNSYLNSGAMYGFQGRYLLPIMPFVHLLFAFVIIRLLKTMHKKKHMLGLMAVSVLMVVVMFQHLPLLTFFRGADASWYTNQTQKLNSYLQTAFDKTRLAKKGSLKSLKPN